MTAPVFPVSAWVRASEAMVLRGGARRTVELPVRYAVWRHPLHGPVVVDGGYGPRLFEGQRSLALRLYAAALRPRLAPSGGLDAALAKIGAAPGDVTTVILTHFHADHVCVARDLPNARFFSDAGAWRALKRMGGFARLRHGVFPELLPDDFDRRLTGFEGLPTRDAPFGLGPAADIFGDGSVLAVPLAGHALGHHGVLFTGDAAPLLYAADSEWMAAALAGRSPGFPAALVTHDHKAARETNTRLLAFQKAGGRVVLCHDPVS